MSQNAYYSNKIQSLSEIFGSPVELVGQTIRVGERSYPIVDDIIVLLEPWQYTSRVQKLLGVAHSLGEAIPRDNFEKDIQSTFGEEWTSFTQILPEYSSTFLEYFKLVDLSGLKDSRVLDLGCGTGRWSWFMMDRCRELVVVDFSDAIFVARENLRKCSSSIFFMGDILRLPFVDNAFDLLFSLGVLHHLPTPALSEVRRLGRLSPRLLVYLYFSLDNRGRIDRLALSLVTAVRRYLCQITSNSLRMAISWAIAVFMYMPLVQLGKLLKPFGMANMVPLYEGYHDRGLGLMRQDAYDRFFTRIEQRVSREEILTLRDTFEHVTVSPDWPYWSFLCEGLKR